MRYQYHTKRRQLTPEELTLARRELVEALIEEDKIAVEKALADKEFKRRMSPFQKTAKELMTKVRSGMDEGSAHCRVVLDSVTQTVKFFIEKRVYDEDTQMHSIEDVLFDELTFEEVGEQQLSMWREEDNEDVVEEAFDRLFNTPAFTVVGDELERVYGESEYHIVLYDLVSDLCKPWPAVAAELWLKHAGSPSTNINIAFTNRPFNEALTMFAAGVALLVNAGVLMEFDKSLFEESAHEALFEIASVSLTLANTLALIEDEVQAEPVEAESEQN